jgi:hypothetical protein
LPPILAHIYGGIFLLTHINLVRRSLKKGLILNIRLLRDLKEICVTLKLDGLYVVDEAGEQRVNVARTARVGRDHGATLSA